MSGQDVEDEFVRWHSAALTDSPQVRAVFAHAAAYVLLRLRQDFTKREWNAIHTDFTEWQGRQEE